MAHPTHGQTARRLCSSAALLFILLASAAPARAQGNPTVPEAMLRAPWEQHLLVLQTLSAPMTQITDPARRAALADGLAILLASLGEYEVQVDAVIDRIIGDAQYAYVAAETSEALSVQLADVHARFETLYAALGVRERADAAAAQASLDALRSTLAAKTPFEADVIRVRASASRPEIVALATRWWKGEERAIAVKKLVADLRQKLEGLPIDEQRR